MPIRVTCPIPSCAKKLSVKDELAGKRVKCPGCQTPIQIPAAEAPPEPAFEYLVPDQEPEPPAPPPSRGVGGVVGLPSELQVPRLVVRAKGGFQLFANLNPFVLPAKVLLNVEEPGTKKVLAIVRRERQSGFDWKKRILGIETKPFRYDVRFRENGPNLMSVSVTRPVAVQLNVFAADELLYELLDGDGVSLGRFRMKQKLFKTDFSFRGPDDLVKAEIKHEVTRGSAAFVVRSPGGQQIGRVLSEGMLKLEEKLATGKGGFSVTTTGIFHGSEGFVAEVADNLVGKPAAHLLVVGLGVIVGANEKFSNAGKV